MKRLHLFLLLLYSLLSSLLFGQMPNDPIRYVALDSIEAEGAWAITTGHPSISIAVVDRYFYTDHEDLINKIDTIWERTIPYDEHGTKVAGLAAAETNNGKGISSIGYQTRLGLYPMNQNNGETEISRVHNATIAASQGGHQIICVSLHSTGLSRSEVIELTQEKGKIFVLAAGNVPDANSHVDIGDIPGVIIVSAVDSIGIFAPLCARNGQVDICAPGNGMYTTYNQYLPYYICTGQPATSYATPLVAGTVALMLAANPELTPGEAETALKNGAKDFLLNDSLYGSGSMGAGRLNAKAAIEEAIKMGTDSIYGDWNGHYDEIISAPSLLQLGNKWDPSDPYFDLTIQDNAYIQFKTYHTVDIYPGFTVANGASFDIEIQDIADKFNKEGVEK